MLIKKKGEQCRAISTTYIVISLISGMALKSRLLSTAEREKIETRDAEITCFDYTSTSVLYSLNVINTNKYSRFYSYLHDMPNTYEDHNLIRKQKKS